jgi:hypothetical protein
MDLTKREKRVVAAGGAAVVATVLVAWVAWPISRRWSDLGRRIGLRERELGALRGRLAEETADDSARAGLIAEMGWLVPPGPASEEEPGRPAERPADRQGEDTGVATPADSPVQGQPEVPAGATEPVRTPLAAELEQTVGECGMELKSVTARHAPGTDESLRHFRPVLLQLELAGKADGLVRLLHTLEKGERFFRVEKLAVRQDVKSPGPVTVSLELFAYEPADDA